MGQVWDRFGTGFGTGFGVLGQVWDRFGTGFGTGFGVLGQVLFLNVSTLPLQAIGQPIPENFASLLSSASTAINNHTTGVGKAIMDHSTSHFETLERKVDLVLRRQEGTCTAADLEGMTHIQKREVNKRAVETLLGQNRDLGPGAAAELADLRRVAKGGQPKVQRKVKAIAPEPDVAVEAVEPEPAVPSAKDLMKVAKAAAQQLTKQHKEDAKTAAAVAKAAAQEHMKQYKELAAAAALEAKSTRRAPKSKAVAAPEPEPVQPVPAEVAAEVAVEVAAPEPQPLPAEVASGSNEVVATAVGPTGRIKNLFGSSLAGFMKP